MNAPVLLFAAVVSAGLHAQGTATPAPTAGAPAGQGTPAAPETKPPAPETKQPETKQPGAGTPQSTPDSKTQPPPSTAGQGAPTLILPPTATVAHVRVRATVDETPTPQAQDFKAGPLTSTLNPDLRIVPGIDITSDLTGAKGGVTLDVTVSGLVAFGELTVPLLYRGRQIETLRFHKPGLIVRRPDGGAIVAQQKSQSLLLVLENPSVHRYERVAARVRFQGIDECKASTDQPGGSGLPPSRSWWDWIGRGFRRAPEPKSCTTDGDWSTFAVRPSSQISLTIPLQDAWFEDRESGLARNANRQGVLTLRYQPESASGTVQPATASGPQVVEQNVPLDVRFEARTERLFLSIVWVFLLLLLGALFFLLLSVAIPNYRRKKILKDKLNETRTATARISDQVDSQLRVLVRVERLALDQRRREGSVLLPGFEEQAARVEAGLAILNRKITFVERLDAATCRRENLVLSPVAPTRLDIIDRNLNGACEALKTDQLGEADWLVIQQRLEAADKALNEPSPEERQAFAALLSQRWQSIRKHFGLPPNSRDLTIPAELTAFAKCFPKGSLLPEATDTDGTEWIDRVGVVRADLQLTALEMLKETHFLAAAFSDSKWTPAVTRLAGWLATPAIANFAPARRQLQQLAEGVSEDDVVCALKEGKAYVDMDPQFVSPNQTVRLTVRFRDPKLNGVTAREWVECEWRFREPTLDTVTHKPAWTWRTVNPWRWLLGVWKRTGGAKTDEQTTNKPVELPPQVQAELGWRVHRYFEPEVTTQRIDVGFYLKGVLVPVDDAEKHYSKVVVPQERSHNKKDSREKWHRFWFQALQMFAVLLVPLVTLAMSTAGEPASGRWWDLVGLGFGSEAIRNILTGEQAPPAP